MEVIEPALVELGEAWHAGELPIAVEHFAAQLCVQPLTGMLAAAQAPTGTGRSWRGARRVSCTRWGC